MWMWCLFVLWLKISFHSVFHRFCIWCATLNWLASLSSPTCKRKDTQKLPCILWRMKRLVLVWHWSVETLRFVNIYIYTFSSLLEFSTHPWLLKQFFAWYALSIWVDSKLCLGIDNCFVFKEWISLHFFGWWILCLFLHLLFIY